MATRYEVRLKSQAGSKVAVFSDWRRLTYKKLLNDVGSYELELNGDNANIADFTTDAQIEIWRYDLATNPITNIVPTIAPYLDFEAFHRTPIRKTDANGLSTFASFGAGYNDLLTRRVVGYYPGSVYADKSGVGETVMKAYVEQNAGPSATAPPRVFSGVMPNVTVQASGGAGLAWAGSRSWVNLLDLCQEISLATSVDFWLVGVGAALFEFQAKARPWGTDRTTGAAKLVFDLGYGNMAVPVYQKNRLNEKNAVLVLGQGQEPTRLVIQRTTTATGDSPWNKCEMIQNGNQEDTVAGLNALGDATLQDLQARESITFQTLQIPSTLYGRDYFVGDLILGKYQTVTQIKQIMGVEITVAEGKESINVILADVPS